MGNLTPTYGTRGNDKLSAGSSTGWIYGEAGDDTITGSIYDDRLHGGSGRDKISGDKGNDLIEGGADADAIDGGEGTDTASYESSAAGVGVDLASGRARGGHADGDRLVNIENLTGSRHADTLLGDAGDNVLDGGEGDDFLRGGAGRDTLIGGGGVDTASYADSGVGVVISLLAGISADDVNGDGDLDAADDANGDGSFSQADFVDTLSQIENVTGSAFGDMIEGSNDANVIDGGGGDDELYGRDGADTLLGGAGADELHGDGQDDILNGGAGGDAINGGLGKDTASYAGSNAGVFIDLANAIAEGGHAHGDTLTSIEHLEGSSHGDVLKGSYGNNVIKGGGGDDVIQGRAGTDELWGGAGNDTFVFDQSDPAHNNSIVGFEIEGIGDFVAGGSEDAIDLTNAGTGYDSLQDVLANSWQATAATGEIATVIDLGPAGSVLLLNVTMAQLTAQDFIFG